MSFLCWPDTMAWSAQSEDVAGDLNVAGPARAELGGTVRAARKSDRWVGGELGPSAVASRSLPAEGAATGRKPRSGVGR